jgi:hypothetical protein
MREASYFPKDFERYLKHRVVFMGTPIDDTIAKLVMAQMICLPKENDRKPMTEHAIRPPSTCAARVSAASVLDRRSCHFHKHLSNGKRKLLKDLGFCSVADVGRTLVV